MRRLGMLALLLTIAACGGTDDDGGKTYASAQAVADAAGCDTWEPEPNDDVEMFATEGGTCEIGDDSLTVNWFKNDTSQENWREVADQMGGDLVLSGDGWVVYGGARETLEAVQAKTGGEIS